MELNQIIKDVITDYNRMCNCTVSEEVISDALLEAVKLHEKEFNSEINEEEAYSLFNMGLYHLDATGEPLDTMDEERAKLFIKEYFTGDFDELLYKASVFKWIPENLGEIRYLSRSIFEIAREEYFKFYPDYDNQECDDMLFKIHELRKGLDSIDYIYRSRDEIIAIYDQELSECILDVDTIHGERFCLSFRLADYIENESSFLTCDPPDFSVKDPFSVPDDLFDDWEDNE